MCQVGKSLDLKLEPVDIHMDPPSAQEFHNSIQDLFTAGGCLLALPAWHPRTQTKVGGAQDCLT